MESKIDNTEVQSTVSVGHALKNAPNPSNNPKMQTVADN